MALSPELFKRLSRLNRELVRKGLAAESSTGALAPGPASVGPGDAAARLETVIPGEPREAAGGRFYLVRRRAEDFAPSQAADGGDAPPAARDLLDLYRRVFFGAGRAMAPDDLHESLRPLVLADPAAVAYLDIETCGLAGEPLFLVGLMRYRQDTLLIEQFLARDYSEERAVLAAAWEVLAETGCLVTFNGKTFDLPTVAARSLACGLFDAPAVPQHVDLLFEARRRWKGVLPNCRLQTIEQLICGRRRAGDIPGGEIPSAYHEFVRSQQADDPVRRVRSLRCLQTILHHNALDLLTMADLVACMLSGQE
ncbi:MAG: ribonuclease H-like domain-containing protein [Planctomycetes bacterium]|nr:ribonuclease H-like domain-containing protein [Planctomycetota bacterium]